MHKIGARLVNGHWKNMSYLSSTFKNIINQESVILSNDQNLSKDAKSIDIDIFENYDYKQMNIMEKLEKLRKQENCTFIPMPTNSLIKQILEDLGPQEVITVLQSPLQYGIFIDTFIGCYLLDYLLSSGNGYESAQVAALIVERGLCNNELITVMCIKSFYTYFKNYTAMKSTKERTEESFEVEKLPVKFVRNIENIHQRTEEHVFGEIMAKLGAHSCEDKQFTSNISLLGSVACGSKPDLMNCIKESNNMLCKDVVEMCKKLIEILKIDNNLELANLLNKTFEESKQTMQFEQILKSRIKLLTRELEPELISDYKTKMEKWKVEIQTARKNQKREYDVQKRVRYIENITSNLNSTRQNLWFFENKEDLDIQIYNKKTHYPKRWFGKTKKPKTVDAFYVPPNINKKN